MDGRQEAAGCIRLKDLHDRSTCNLQNGTQVEINIKKKLKYQNQIFHLFQLQANIYKICMLGSAIYTIL